MKHRTVQKMQSSAFLSFAALAVLVIIFTIINHSFLSPDNVENLLESLSPMLIMAMGTTPVILLGSTDLSIGAVVSLGTVIFAKFAPDLGIYTYLLVLGVGIASGCMVGILNAKLKVPSFIASLAFMSIWSSAALILTDSGGPIAFPKKYWPIVAWARTQIGRLPSSFLLAGVVFISYWILIHHTVLGSRIYAIGANEKAARLAGVPCVSTKVIVFTMAGFLYAVAGILYLAKILSGNPGIGDDFTLLTIAAVALGGISLSGGKGTVFGTLLGTAFAAVITNGLTVIGVDSWWQKVVFGAVIIITAYMTSDKKNTAAVK
ncbi:ABC transporter permease [Diplocloster hominis]|uniref:ABC transporter permease n=1 Tax=Diplocloster hominis TaxID=3079010 RepID=UPI0031BBBFC0